MPPGRHGGPTRKGSDAMSKSRSVLLTTAAVVTALGLSACSAGSTTTGKGTGGAASDAGSRDLAIGLVLEPASLDFTKTAGAAIPQALMKNVYQTLVTLDQDGKFAPSLAKSWTISPDRTTYTFDLVDNATFTNGQKFTAEDAVFSINRAKTDWTVAQAKTMDVVAKATAQSPTRLVVTLSRPSNDWLFRMTTLVGAMFSQTGVDALATKPVGTGPYRFEAWKRGDSISLVRNDSYWGNAPYFEKVTLKYIKDPTALNNALLTGTINVIGTVQAPEALAQFSGNDAFQVIEGTTTGEVVLSMNHSKAPLSDKRVRQAARHAIDHQALLDTCWAGKGTLIGSMVPPTDPWYEDLTGVAPYDQTKARELLGQAGQANPSVRLRIPVLPYATSCGQVVKSQLEDVGFTVKLEQLEFPTWLTDVYKNADYDMSIVSHVEARDLPTVFGNPDYYLRYQNPQLTKLLAAADAGTEAEQTENMKKAARLISEDAAADWLFLLPNLMVTQKGITGLPTNAVTDALDLTALARS